MSTAGEVTRLRHDISRVRDLLRALESSLDEDIPLLDLAQAAAETALRVATTTARRDAYLRAGVK